MAILPPACLDVQEGFSFGGEESSRTSAKEEPAVRELIRQFYLALMLCLIAINGWAQPPAKDTPQASSSSVKSVLLLHSYNYSQPAQLQIAAGLESARRIADLSPEDYLHEYLDISPPQYPEQRSQLRQHLLRKYAGRHFDLIITVFDDALSFLLDEGKELSPDSPCLALFCQERPGLERAGKKVIQTPLYFDVRGTLELALQIFPKTRNVLFVSGTGTLDKTFERQARVDFVRWQEKLNIEYTGDRSLEEVLERVASLPPGTIVLYSRVSADITGKMHSPGHVAAVLAKSSNAPVFCLATSQLESGVVGGSMVDVAGLSAMLGRVLPSMNGKEPLAIEPASRFVRPMLNWEQIPRWNVDTSLVPNNSLIINRPLTLWSQHKTTVMTSVLVLGLCLVSIVTLIVQNRRMAVAERTVRLSEARFRVLIDRSWCSTTFSSVICGSSRKRCCSARTFSSFPPT